MSGWDKVGWSWMYDGHGNRKLPGNWPIERYREHEAKEWRRENPAAFRRAFIPADSERVCIGCGKPFQGDSGEWEGDVLIFRHESGDCRIGGRE